MCINHHYYPLDLTVYFSHFDSHIRMEKSFNFEDIKICETKLYVYKLIFDSFMNLNKILPLNYKTFMNPNLRFCFLKKSSPQDLYKITLIVSIVDAYLSCWWWWAIHWPLSCKLWSCSQWLTVHYGQEIKRYIIRTAF